MFKVRNSQCENIWAHGEHDWHSGFLNLTMWHCDGMGGYPEVQVKTTNEIRKNLKMPVLSYDPIKDTTPCKICGFQSDDYQAFAIHYGDFVCQDNEACKRRYKRKHKHKLKYMWYNIDYMTQVYKCRECEEYFEYSGFLVWKILTQGHIFHPSDEVSHRVREANGRHWRR